ncbi:putative phage abortive infection protein [Bacillus cereus]
MKETKRTGLGWGILIGILIILGIASLILFYIIPFKLIQNPNWIPLGDLKSFFFNTNDASELKSISNSDVIGALGTVGDWFGGTTVPVLTFLSYIGVMIAIIMQRQELELQRKELQDTRDVFKLQQFENTFFNMITLNNDIITNMKIDIGKISGKESDSPSSGRDSFSNLYSELTCVFSNKDMYTGEGLEKIINSYEIFFSSYQDSIGHYFRNLYRITKFIHENETLSKKQKQNYIGILRAQLSTYELLLIFYNGLSEYGSEKFLPLIKQYNLLDNINNTLLYDETLHWEVFNDFEEKKIQVLRIKFNGSIDLKLYEDTIQKLVLNINEKILNLASVPEESKANHLNDMEGSIKKLIEISKGLSKNNIVLLNSILMYSENYKKELLRKLNNEGN